MQDTTSFGWNISLSSQIWYSVLQIVHCLFSFQGFKKIWNYSITLLQNSLFELKTPIFMIIVISLQLHLQRLHMLYYYYGYNFVSIIIERKDVRKWETSKLTAFAINNICIPNEIYFLKFRYAHFQYPVLHIHISCTTQIHAYTNNRMYGSWEKENITWWLQVYMKNHLIITGCHFIADSFFNKFIFFCCSHSKNFG